MSTIPPAIAHKGVSQNIPHDGDLRPFLFNNQNIVPAAPFTVFPLVASSTKPTNVYICSQKPIVNLPKIEARIVPFNGTSNARVNVEFIHKRIVRVEVANALLIGIQMTDKYNTVVFNTKHEINSIMQSLNYNIKNNIMIHLPTTKFFKSDRMLNHFKNGGAYLTTLRKRNLKYDHPKVTHMEESVLFMNGVSEHEWTATYCMDFSKQFIFTRDDNAQFTMGFDIDSIVSLGRDGCIALGQPVLLDPDCDTEYKIHSATNGSYNSNARMYTQSTDRKPKLHRRTRIV